MDDLSRYRELSDDEIKAAELPDEDEDVQPPVKPPADAEPVETAARRLFGGWPPDGVWAYVNEQGEALFYVCRWNARREGERKAILPICWFANHPKNHGRPGWAFGHWPAPRPLYNLDKIVANPGAPVVIVEGEKSADAAARVFPKSVVTTSAGGSSAVALADWSALAGRRVAVWSDDDAPGGKYATAVAETLDALDCDVSIVDADKLRAQISSTYEAGTGWDAADAVADCPDLEALRKAAGAHAKPFEPGPGYASFGPYTMGAKGLEVEVEVGRGKNRETVKVRVSGAFELLGRCRDPQGNAWGKVLRWNDPDKREHEKHVSDAALQGDPAALASILADAGLEIVPSYQRHLRNYLSAARSKRRVTLVQRTGWHVVNDRSVFVLPEAKIGARGTESVILDAAARGPYDMRGSIDDWRAGVAALAKDHLLARLAISTALAGPLLNIAGVEGGGLNIFGPSSTGKTTALRAAASVWGRGDTPGYVRSWRATANGLEGASAGATDTVLVLDELGQIDGREMASATYMLSNGSGKARAARDGSLREPKSWRVLIISSGEMPIDTKLAEDRGRKSRGGQQMRMLDIQADRGLGYGVFDSAGPTGNAKDVADAFRLAATSAYGIAGPEFVRALLMNDVTGDDVRSFVKEFVAAHVPPGVDGQVERAGQRLGLIAAAGELATEFQLTGWKKGDATRAAAWALATWIDNRGGTGAFEDWQAVAQVRLFIEAHGQSRFQSLLPIIDSDSQPVEGESGVDSGSRPVVNRAGWRKGQDRDERWLIPSETWKTEVCAGLDSKLVARVLAKRGMIEKAPDGFQPVHKIAGKPVRVYVVTPQIFDGGENEH